MISFFGIIGKLQQKKNSVFGKWWCDRSILFTSNLLNSDGKFLTLEEFQNKLNIKVNYLHYFQLIAAIPLDLKRKALDSAVPDLCSAPTEYFQLKDSMIVLIKFCSKNYYKPCIERLNTEPSAIRSWKKYFPKLPDWSNCFADIHKSSKDDKLRQFSFNVMHGIIPTQ